MALNRFNVGSREATHETCFAMRRESMIDDGNSTYRLAFTVDLGKSYFINAVLLVEQNIQAR